MPQDEIRNIVKEVRNILAFHRSIGITDYPGTRELLDFLSSEEPGTGTPLSERRRQDAKTAAPPPEPAMAKSAEVLVQEMRQELEDCRRCSLSAARNKVVFGGGNIEAELFIIGEWPAGADDISGSPFSGEDGALLTRMLKAIGLTMDQVFVTNLVLCRPEGNRPPKPEEIKTCLPFLLRTMSIISPKVICTFGPLAAQALLKTRKPLIQLRGRFHSFQGIPLMPTFHPAFLLKNEEFKKPVWQDLQMIQKKMAASAG